MLGGVDLAIHAQDFLRARNAHVVDELMAEVAEAGAEAGAGECRHPGAARAAVEVQAELRAPAAQRAQRRRQDFVQIGIAFEDFAEAVFHHDRQAQVGAASVSECRARVW